MKRSRITFLLPAAALAVLILAGGWIYFSNYRKQTAAYQENIVVERKINLARQINVEYLKAVRDNRGYRLQQDSFHRQQYFSFKQYTQALFASYKNGITDTAELDLFTAYEQIIQLRFQRLDLFIDSPGSRDSLSITSDIIAAIRNEDDRYKALINFLKAKSRLHEQTFNRLKNWNNILFTVWIALAVLLMVLMTFLLRRRWLTEQEAYETEQVRKQNERITNILEGTNAGTWEWNVQTGETIFNETWANLIGYTLEELQPVSIETWVKFAHPDDLAVSNQKLQACFNHQSDYYDCECRMKHKDGHWVWVLDRGKVLSWTEDRKPLWMFGTHIDISAFKQLEFDLKESKSFIDAVLETVDAGIVVCDAEGHLKLFNKATREMHGLPEQALSPDEWSKHYHLYEGDAVTPLPTEHIPLYKAWKGLPAKDLDMAIRHTSGKTIFVKANGSQIFDKDGKVAGAVVAMHDITAAKQSQLQLEEREQKFRGIFHSTFQFIGFLSPDGTVLEANQTALQFADLQPEDVIGKKFWDCYWWQINQATQQHLKEAIEKAAAGEIVKYEVEVWDKDKHPVTILFNLKPLLNNEGKVVAIIPEGRPIQDMVEAREALLQKNQELEAFASMAAHDLKEPARMIGNFMQLLKTKYGEQVDEVGMRYIDFAVTGSKRMNELINDLLEYARAGADGDTFTKVETEAVMLETLAQLDAVITDKQARIKFEHLPVINVQKTGLQILFRNLISNAIKYQLPENKPVVTISCTDQKSHWQFLIEDNGIGIDPEYLQTVFQLFKRLHGKEEYNGTGMGLATCKKIVELHGGRIWVESEKGKGSRFYFTIEKR